jgi:hypothetical protein
VLRLQPLAMRDVIRIEPGDGCFTALLHSPVEGRDQPAVAAMRHHEAVIIACVGCRDL